MFLNGMKHQNIVRVIKYIVKNIKQYLNEKKL